MKNRTTIQIEKATRKRLTKYRIYPRETFGEMLVRFMDGEDKKKGKV